MKKFLSLILVSLMLISLASCEAVFDFVDEHMDEDIKGKTEDVTGDDEKDPEGTTTSKENEQKDFGLGVVTGKKWENSFIGLGCTLPSDWEFYTEEEIKSLNNVASDAVGEEYEAILKSASVFYDMFAHSSDNTCNMNVTLEKMTAAQVESLDVKKNYEAIAPVLKGAYENMGFTSFSYEITSIKVSGVDFPCIMLVAGAGTVEMHQMLLNVKCGSYLASISVTALTEEMRDTLIGNLYTLK